MKRKISLLSSIIISLQILLSGMALPAFADAAIGQPYEVPEAPSAVYNMNIDWKYLKPATTFPLASALDSAKDANGRYFYEKDYDDASWETVSVPHAINADDAFVNDIADAGDTNAFRGIVFYRKHFTVPEEDAGKKLFLEFDGIRQGAYLWVNGQEVGYYEAGVAAFGFDITNYVTPGEEAVIALANDGTSARGSENYLEETRPGSAWGAGDGAGYQWNTKDFNPAQIGLVYDVRLRVKDDVYQTLPLYNNLKTTGKYIYGTDYDIREGKVTINVDAEVRNESGADENLTLDVNVVDHEGILKYSFSSQSTSVPAATDAGVVYETAVEDDVYSPEKTTVTETLPDSTPEELEIINDPSKRPDSNETCAYITYVEHWSDWKPMDDSVSLTGFDDRGYRLIYGIGDGSSSTTETDDAEKATHYKTLNSVERQLHNETYATEIITPDVSHITASYTASDVRFWNIEDPYLYTIYTVLKDAEGNVIDVDETTTGFRKVEYDFDGTSGQGLTINDEPVWLTGYAQRSTNEWAAIGVGNDWLTDYDMELLKESGSNFIRWMHVAPRPNSVRSTDKYGIAVVVPAGDKEGDASDRGWSQRMETMRDVMIYFRNSPSVLFWETGNNQVVSIHQQEVTDLKALIDPYGGRYAGCRTLSSVEQIEATEYVGTMLNRHAANAFNSMKTANKFVPIMETEYHREEAPRRVWDDYSPPDYDYVNNWLGAGAKKDDSGDIHDLTSEDFVLSDAASYQEFYNDRVGGQSGNNYYSAAAALIWADSNQHGRNAATENARTSGRVDAIRIPKQSFYAYQVMQSEEAAVHIVGHWNYEPVDDLSMEEGGNYYYQLRDSNGKYNGEWARRDPTKKTVYVVGTPTQIDHIDLLVDGEVVAQQNQTTNTFIYPFYNIDVTQGDKVEAVAYDAQDREVARHEIVRAGEPVAVRLTPVTVPVETDEDGNYVSGGLMADGGDLMYFDVEIVDAEGNVCPLSYDRIDFKLTGDAEFMGGYNSGKLGAEDTVIGKDYVYAECGVNRVFVKAGRTAGTITLEAAVGGLASATASVTSYAVDVEGGLTETMPTTLTPGVGAQPVPVVVPEAKPLGMFASVNKDNWSDYIYTVEDIVIDRTHKITVNGNEVSFPEGLEPFKPDDTTGVVAPADLVLEALKAAGADVTYSYSTVDDKLTLTMTQGTTTVTAKAGDTTLDIVTADGTDQNLLNYEITLSEDGEHLWIEIAPLTGYLDGVTSTLDVEGKTLNYTVG